ncbi:helix-turn-helix transcriptional regulator [Paenibacillus faecis]|uniref:Helix-turn-helix transcriptional regulator n=1 Tax=Paenibacillus faecis TaxID=862114 RepID=A0A5D0CQC1_9BACL|nr:helix-turn-helix transcriptional regulator [Paenibacillus faecis]TYA10947.1 helix-turn-helix transcriptional regulator [Paenibacillus faecis]
MMINHLSEIMGRKRLTQRDVVRGTGLAINTVAGLYRDESKRVDLDTIDKLCKFLGVTVGEIFEYKEDEEDEHVTQGN